MLLRGCLGVQHPSALGYSIGGRACDSSKAAEGLILSLGLSPDMLVLLISRTLGSGAGCCCWGAMLYVPALRQQGCSAGLNALLMGVPWVWDPPLWLLCSMGGWRRHLLVHGWCRNRGWEQLLLLFKQKNVRPPLVFGQDDRGLIWLLE